MKHYFERDAHLLPVRVARFQLILPVLAIGCAHLFGSITYYDPTTYKNLTDLKPEVTVLYETFASDSINTTKIAIIRLMFAQIYEYERGKGTKNEETRKQIEIIRKLFEKHVNDRLTHGQWNHTHLQNNIQNMSEAFDIAIQTEHLKNKNEP